MQIGFRKGDAPNWRAGHKYIQYSEYLHERLRGKQPGCKTSLEDRAKSTTIGIPGTLAATKTFPGDAPREI